jgi:hypothetical protein
VVEEEKQEEEAVESARNSFALYHPDHPNNVTAPLAVLLLALAAGAGLAGLRKRHVRGGAALARTEIRSRPRRWSGPSD